MTGSIRIAQTEELNPVEVAAVSALCEAAFAEPWSTRGSGSAPAFT
jgi:hypothetical protein